MSSVSKNTSDRSAARAPPPSSAKFGTLRSFIILYVLMYAAFGVASPFWPEYFRTKALNSEEIGLVLGAAMVMRLAAGPLVGRLADIAGSLRAALAGCAVLAAATWPSRR